MNVIALPCKLSTPYETGTVAHVSIFPVPRLRRISHCCLNGVWSPAMEKQGKTALYAYDLKKRMSFRSILPSPSPMAAITRYHSAWIKAELL